MNRPVWFVGFQGSGFRVQGSGFQVSWFTVSVSNLTAYSITVFEKQKMGETGY